jgi:hypothetical protein
VFRAVVLSIVLALAVGQYTALLCAVSCHPNEGAAPECQHHDAAAAPRLTAAHGCGSAVVGMTALRREDARRGAPRPDPQRALVVPQFRMAPPPTDGRRIRTAGHHSPLDQGPFTIALRI